jgi:hypothetical protein
MVSLLYSYSNAWITGTTQCGSNALTAYFRFCGTKAAQPRLIKLRGVSEQVNTVRLQKTKKP